MSTSTITTLLTNTLTDYGTSLLTVLTAIVGVGIAFVLFRFGWRKIRGVAR